MLTATDRIHLRDGIFTLLDPDDLERLGGKKPYLANNGYAYLSFWIDGKAVSRTLHGWIISSPAGSHIDHINGDKLDNRQQNLRVVTPQINQVNRKRLNRNNTSGFRGVYRYDGARATKWWARISVDGSTRHLGSFATHGEAVAARIAAEIELFGEECPR